MLALYSYYFPAPSMEPKGCLPCSQGPDPNPYPEPDPYSPQLLTLFPSDPL